MKYIYIYACICIHIHVFLFLFLFLFPSFSPSKVNSVHTCECAMHRLTFHRGNTQVTRTHPPRDTNSSTRCNHSFRPTQCTNLPLPVPLLTIYMQIYIYMHICIYLQIQIYMYMFTHVYVYVIPQCTNLRW